MMFNVFDGPLWKLDVPGLIKVANISNGADDFSHDVIAGNRVIICYIIVNVGYRT